MQIVLWVISPKLKMLRYFCILYKFACINHYYFILSNEIAPVFHEYRLFNIWSRLRVPIFMNSLFYIYNLINNIEEDFSDLNLQKGTFVRSYLH